MSSASLRAYTPYGHFHYSLSNQQLLGFNGELLERHSGAYLLGNGYRPYNPIIMRFLAPDSWSPFGKGGLNAYGYCAGDSINNVDPDGHAVVNRLRRHAAILMPDVPPPKRPSISIAPSTGRACRPDAAIRSLLHRKFSSHAPIETHWQTVVECRLKTGEIQACH